MFKFYTAENPNNYVFKKHNGLIRKISWLQDDTGFISIGWDSAVYGWKLDKQEPEWTYKKKNCEFTCVTSFKNEGGTTADLQPYIYVTGTDKSIHELKGINKSKGEGQIPEAKVINRYEQSVNLSQIVLMHNRRAFFTCIDEKDRPGSIQVLRGDTFNKDAVDRTVFEIQAHSLNVQRLKLSYDNNTLFSASSDGSLCVFTLADKVDPKKKILDLPSSKTCTEFLTPKMQREKIRNDIRNLNDSIKAAKANKA